ncbi:MULTISPECIES: flagellar biosynthesis anti-sigma factor FlgM [unclassified Marinobacter]|uniref:flagellar biosynthesis anti-sigma factor FlgM n=1 Tax=unclassified Marinobacter TaxID=83889 RepID=UPI0026E2EC8A|nr:MULTISPECIES: flagellar biosynthesis anti-sigma factor FlgM [unclassified Marinobacter]MDO6442182.1 flagellar biosynthesis anti-sigma factor FlgM [Marinobacter sp. 2_MG-2023]MDO6825052.1 flagellar biosynthesis anti-sigma factor FlgM [Marinobacter sp. 1_MG-2023]
MSVDLNGIGQGQVNIQRPTADKSSNSQNTGQTTPEQANNAKAQGARGENVNLSSQARNLKQLEQKLGDYPEMDDERIEEIRAALADGTYKIDAEKLAQKMLDMDKSIFG